MHDLIRISEVFSEHHAEILKRLDAAGAKKLGTEFYLLPGPMPHSELSLLVRWQMPIHHSWPCNPEKTEHFLDKACFALEQKCAAAGVQQVMVSPLISGSPHPYFKKLATALRQRLMASLLDHKGKIDPEEQNPQDLTLFCLVGKEGLFASIATPRDCGGFYAGGSKYISHKAAHSISRAGAKIAEALHFLRLHRPALPETTHWLELGASPGGMTAELLERGYHVTAVDRAPMDPRISSHPRLNCYAENAAAFFPPRGERYDALLCDMNGPARESFAIVAAKLPYLQPGSLIIFTLKTHKAGSLDEWLELLRQVQQDATRAGLRSIAHTHLTYNRHEFTLIWQKP